ncbi:uncharacterized protein NEMAJ01_0640 [Nematocida major]|uniref:uncharacterized protein n=1 Tax=Nematocida major TaxID=1912982 RepID=UPI002008225F|nr:uncharacterized protein NEMAJ01_0640 [Nematocida major]KAH9385744.1 hypothetical protein NEMAJ01_0640 [Nematocida major]
MRYRYPHADLLVMWGTCNKISITLAAVNAACFIDRKWGLLYCVEYAYILAVFLALVKDKYIRRRIENARLIELLHILFVSPLFYGLFSGIGLFHAGVSFGAGSFLLSFHRPTSRALQVLSSLCFSTEAERIDSANGATIFFILAMRALSAHSPGNIYAERALALVLNILLSNFSECTSVLHVSAWEFFCTVVSPCVLVLLYEKKHLLKEKKRLQGPPRRRQLFLQEQLP